MAKRPLIPYKGFLLELTCAACPEQYDVFRNGEQVGYMRLRNHNFEVYAGGYGDQLVYSFYISGSGGDFPNADSRKFYIGQGLDALDTAIFSKQIETLLDNIFDDED